MPIIKTEIETEGNYKRHTNLCRSLHPRTHTHTEQNAFHEHASFYNT